LVSGQSMRDILAPLTCQCSEFKYLMKLILLKRAWRRRGSKGPGVQSVKKQEALRRNDRHDTSLYTDVLCYCILSLNPERSKSACPYTVRKSKLEFCCTVALGKFHSHTIIQQHLYTDLRWFENSVDPCDFDLWPLFEKAISVTRARKYIFIKLKFLWPSVVDLRARTRRIDVRTDGRMTSLHNTAHYRQGRAGQGRAA